MRKQQYTLSEKEITLALDIISQSELFNVKIESCKDYYKMTQPAAKNKASKIMDKLVRQRELIIKQTL
jgi:hypothetical protein